MAWKLKIYFDDGEVEEVDEDFETEEDAEKEYEDWLENYQTGCDVLMLSDPFDEDNCTGKICDYEIWEEDTTPKKKRKR